MIARQADQHTWRGHELAGRRAFYSARLEFTRALRLVSQGLDAQNLSVRHSQALAAGLRAMSEAADFIPRLGRLEAELDVPTIIGAHATPILKGVDARHVTPLQALRHYFGFAQEQLAASVGEEVAGSVALQSLGKLHMVVEDQHADSVVAAGPKAMAFLQAALIASPRNYMASNELGVLLARGGRHHEARAAFDHSIVVQPTAEAWRNLALTCEHLGNMDAAYAAARQSMALRENSKALASRRHATRGPQIEWLDPAVFAARSARLGGGKAPGEWSSLGPNEASSEDALTGSTARSPSASMFWKRTQLRVPADGAVTPCQAIAPAAARPVSSGAVAGDWSCRGGWESTRAATWGAYAQGEYIAHHRSPHVRQYRLRVDDELDLVYRLTREERPEPYRINVGDEIQIESMADPTLDRTLIVQPDGTITLRLLGQRKATGLTVAQLQEHVEEAYKEFYRMPAITVTPIKVDTKLEDLRATVDRRQGIGGQSQIAKITPEGTISLPAIGSVYIQGLTLGELATELSEHYRAVVPGVEVIPVLIARAPRYVYVLGEVGAPGRFEMTGPTTLLQSLAMAGSWNNGAHISQIVVFRREDDWRLTATMVDLRAALRGKSLCPAGEIWLSDSDVIIVPKSPILEATDFIELVFTRGIYGVLPFGTSYSFNAFSVL